MAEPSKKNAGLSSILPRQELVKRFGSALTLEEYGKTALKAIADKNPGVLHHVAASVWNRIVQKKWHPVNPRQFSEYFDTRNPKFYKALSESLGAEIIRDILPDSSAAPGFTGQAPAPTKQDLDRIKDRISMFYTSEFCALGPHFRNFER